MIKKEDLEQLENLRKEREDLRERILKLEAKPRKILTDGVKGSSTDFPYTQHTCKVEGLDDSITYRRRKNTIKKLKKILKTKEEKINKAIIHIEYELNYIQDSEIREIIRMKYEDDLSWIQIMHRRGYNSENTARMKLGRFFEKNI